MLADLDINGKKVGVQTICLAENGAKLISDNGMIRDIWAIILGVPLVEIALEPVTWQTSRNNAGCTYPGQAIASK